LKSVIDNDNWKLNLNSR